MSDTKITIKQLKESNIGQPISGVILLKNYKVNVSKASKKYITGSVQNNGDFPCVIWDEMIISRLEGFDANNTVINIEGDVREFSNKPTLTILSLDVLSDADPEEFMCNRYTEALESEFAEFLETHISQTGLDILNDILFESGYWIAFSKEFAAKSHHDNVRRGLLAHVMKGLRILSVIVPTYECLKSNPDLVYISWVLHDVGKILELKNGVYQANSFVTHRMLGAEMLFSFKDKIIGAYGTEAYYKIQSVVMGHHHDYDDKARTTLAYAIHLVDLMDCKLTVIDQLIENGAQNEQPAGEFIFLDNNRLFL